MRYYTIRDLKAQSFEKPFFAQNDAVAVRSLAVEASRPDSMLSRFSSDYELWFCGTFDPAHGVFLPAEKPLFVSSVQTVIAASQEVK